MGDTDLTIPFAARVLDIVQDRLGARARNVDAVAIASIVLTTVETVFDLQELDALLDSVEAQDLGGGAESDVVLSEPGHPSGAPERSDVVPTDRGPVPSECIEDDREAPS